MQHCASIRVFRFQLEKWDVSVLRLCTATLLWGWHLLWGHHIVDEEKVHCWLLMFICFRQDRQNGKGLNLTHFINQRSVIRSSASTGWKMTNNCYVNGMESRNVNTWMGSMTTPESSPETKAEPQVFFDFFSVKSAFTSDLFRCWPENVLHEIIIMDEVRM